jgi:hypothetical protein
MKSVSSGKTRGSHSRHRRKTKNENEKISKISKAFREAKKTSIETITKRIRTYYINTD